MVNMPSQSIKGDTQIREIDLFYTVYSLGDTEALLK